jgi:ubiquinone biosynthesis accessory factor UbiK
MLDRQFLDDLASRIAQLSPRAKELGGELRGDLKQLLQSSFSKLNILTREEFDAQVEAVKRAEQRIEILEKELAALEQELANKRSRPE